MTFTLQVHAEVTNKILYEQQQWMFKVSSAAAGVVEHCLI